MSYCRWSSDDYKSDLYCYQDVNGGWTTMVASHKIVGKIPQADKYFDRAFRQGASKEDTDAWEKARKEQHNFLEKAEHQPIGLSCDGEIYNDATLEDFLERVTNLIDMGYNAPNHLIKRIKREMKED